MKAYVLTTGVVFLLVLAAHIARLFSEGLHPVQSPWFVITSALSLMLVVWAWRLFRQLSPRK